MPQVELTDKFCRSAKARAGANKTDFFDAVVRGLCLRVSKAGLKTWHVVYSKPGRPKERVWLKLGRYPEIGLGGDAGARQRARGARVRIGDGADPVAEKKAQASAQTVRDLVENYLSDKVADKRSVAEIARRLRKNVSGYDAYGKPIEDRSRGCIGDIRLSDLHRRDITKAIDAVKKRGAATESLRVFTDLRAMVRWARGRGDLDENIMELMAPPAEARVKDRVLAPDEIQRMWGALAEARMTDATRRIIRLCLVTGQRVGEVAGMTRAELDLDQGIWTIPAARTKNAREHVVPLSDMALTILREQLAAGAGDALLFPGLGGQAPVTSASVATTIKRLERVGEDGAPLILGVAPWTPHDLRRTAATCMEELGVSPFVVGHVLNHVSATKASITSRVYARYDYMKEKREALELWGARLSAIVNSANVVVPMRKGESR
ncbi:MAG: tyrosine-type recombinase/integrase [Hyphomonadaceae bacterium]|nr:tyrosine-type recombinase/integrase [Hyphomonadaceae bacterium]